MDLCKNNEAFFYKDHVLDDQTYRIFNYRLCSHTDFLSSGALECRGHMFNITVEGRPVIVCLPMQKFFNLGEINWTRYEELQFSLKNLYDLGNLSLANFEKLSHELDEKFK